MAARMAMLARESGGGAGKPAEGLAFLSAPLDLAAAAAAASAT